MKTFYWLLKREFWEHRGGFLWAPVITGGIYLLFFLIGLVWALGMARHGFSMDGNEMGEMFAQAAAGHSQHVGEVLDGFIAFSVMLVLIVCGFVVLFYCLGALYDDRRDRSVLFWKSLPLSNASTVLSKVVSAGVIAPVIALVVGLLTALVQLVILLIAMAIHGVNPWQVLMQTHLLRMTVTAVSLIPLSALWALPSIGWLLLCSAWARSKPFLWAILIPAIANVLVWWFSVVGLFSTHFAAGWSRVLARLLGSVFPNSFLYWGEPDLHFDAMTNGGRLADSSQLIGNAYHLLASPSLWIGVLGGTVLVAGAVWLRRVRDDS